MRFYQNSKMTVSSPVNVAKTLNLNPNQVKSLTAADKIKLLRQANSLNASTFTY